MNMTTTSGVGWNCSQYAFLASASEVAADELRVLRILALRTSSSVASCASR